MLLISLFISITSAESSAISVPSLILIAILAFVKAGASFIPSPTIATNLPSLIKSAMYLSLSCGRALAMTSLIPTSLAIIPAVIGLSPVNIYTSILFLPNSLIAFFTSFLIVSRTPINASTFLFSIT